MRYALITGGSQGIGRAIARELASRGFGLLIVALDNDFLRETVKVLSDEFPVPVFAIPSDLTLPDAAERLAKFVENEGYPIQVLVNNAGFGRGKLFEDIPLATYHQMMALNNGVMVALCHSMLPILRRNGPAYILNLGSMESYLPMPVKVIYTATKHFVLGFSLALGTELKGSGISVSVLCPGPVLTNTDGLQRIRSVGAGARLLLMQPHEVAPLAVKGLFQGQRVIVPGRMNRFILLLNHFLPLPMRMAMLRKTGMRFLEQ